MRTIAVVVLLIVATQGRASSFVTLMGANSPVPDRVTSRGPWSVVKGNLTLEGNRHGPGLWFPELAAGIVGDGTVRMALRVEPGHTGSLYLRARYGLADLDRISGYRVDVGPTEVVLLRMDDGVSTELRRSSRPAQLGADVLSVELLGERLRVSAAGSVMTASDGHHRAGRVGVGGNAIIDFLDLDSGTRATEMPPSERPSLGDRRLVSISAEDVMRLTPAELGHRVMTSAMEGRTLLLLDGRERRKLIERGIEPKAEGGDVPWRALEPSGPTAYASPDDIVARLEAAARAYPKIARVERLGETWQRRPIVALRISDNVDVREGEPSVLLNGAHHGHELMSTLQVLDAIDLLLKGYGNDVEITRFVNELDIVCVPLVNPDGTNAFLEHSGATGRKNGRDIDGDGAVSPWDGVDLNRNYPFRFGALGEKASRSSTTHWFYRGPEAGSEPETKAMMALAHAEHFTAAISFHTLSTVLLAPYTIRGAKRPSPDDIIVVANTILAALPEQPNSRRFKVVREIYAVDGTDQDWLYNTFGTAAFIVEGPLHNATDTGRRTGAVVAQRAAWQALLRATLGNSVLSGKVVDHNGAPLIAEVVVDNVKLHESERWTSRPRDGAFHRILGKPGHVKISVRANGYLPWEGVAATGTPLVVVLQKQG